MCTKPTETCSMPIPLKQKSECCAKEVPQDILPCSKQHLQPPIDSLPRDLHMYTDPSKKEKDRYPLKDKEWFRTITMISGHM